MITTRRNFVRAASVLAIANVAHGANLPLQQDIPIQSGPFSAEGLLRIGTSAPNGSATPSSASGLTGAPTVGYGEGDWYARNMYMQGSRQYEYHVKTYGHPSKFGYKDIIPLWKAERWDPRSADSRYKQPRARNTSSAWASTATISISGTLAVTAGTRSRWVPSATSSASGVRPPAPPVSASASASTCGPATTGGAPTKGRTSRVKRGSALRRETTRQLRPELPPTRRALNPWAEQGNESDAMEAGMVPAGPGSDRSAISRTWYYDRWAQYPSAAGAVRPRRPLLQPRVCAGTTTRPNVVYTAKRA